MNNFSQEIRQVLRKLVRAPLFTLTTVGTLALGIGANAAIFSIVNGVLLKPLPFENSEELVGVWHTAPGLGFDQINSSPALHFTYRDENRVFEDVGHWDNRQVSVTGLDEPEQMRAMYMTASVLPLLRVQPAIGRRFTEEDDSPGTPETIMLSHAYWQTQFGSDPGVLGSTLRVNGVPREVIGVLPPGFDMPRTEASIYLPFRWNRAETQMGNFSFQAIARLSPGATIEQANADVARMIPLSVEQFPGGITVGMLEEAGFGPNVHTLKEDFVGDVGQVLWVLLGTVGMVLLIACANVANLFLVRAEGRQQEMAVRTAMGAAGGRIARQFLMESLTLGLLGGVGGLMLAFVGVEALVALGPESLPRLNEISLEPVVLLFTFGVSLLSGLLFGLFPVVRFRGSNLVASLKEGGRGGSAGKQTHRARNALVVAQVALALVLLTGSGLMIRSFQALRNVNPGFERPEEVLTFRVTVPTAEVEDNEQVALVYEQILTNLERIPGVTSVGASYSLPMDDYDSSDALWVEDIPVVPDQIPAIRRFKWIAGDYFETMENPLLAGRTITWADIHDRAPVAVVTENFAREYWDDPASALSERIGSGDPSDLSWREIVGVVGNVHDDGLSEDPTLVVYWPMAMNDFYGGDGAFVQRAMAFAVRTSRPSPSTLLPEARQAVWSVNGNLPLANVQSLQDILDGSLARTSFTLIMLAIAAAVALILGVVGIYGVISYIVSQRTREIGVRMALGADQSDVSRMVLRQGMILAGSGLVVGLLAAAGLTRLMGSLLYGVEATDPVTFATVAALLGGVALLASYLPALRAARTDPVEALRFE